MIIYNKLLRSNSKTSVALGLFDGIHLGHQAVISKAVDISKPNLVPTVFTLNNIYKPNAQNKGKDNIISKGQKEILLENIGIKQVYEIDFSSISKLSPQDFVNTVLVDKLNAKKVVCGFNYHFGFGAKANAYDLKKLCNEKNIDVVIIAPLNYKENPISSTRIKNCIKEAKLDDVKNMLGRYFSFENVVVNGKKLGRTIGIPTINQDFEEGLIVPKFGVYFSITTYGSKKYCSVTNIGLKPTFEGSKPNIETWLIDYNGDDIYGHNVKVELVKYLREEKKFTCLQDLKNQILIDASMAKKMYNNLFDKNHIKNLAL